MTPVADTPAVPSDPEQTEKDEPDLEHFSQLPIHNRVVPAEQWKEEVSKKNRRFVKFSHIALHCQSGGQAKETKDNIIIGVLFYNSSSEKLQNGEQFVKWRLTDLGQPEPRNITVHLRWQACLHWRKREHAAQACRGAIIAILNPHLIEVATKIGTKETLLLVENPKQIEKLGECPILGSCKKKGCKLPCNRLLRETYCRLHLDLMYANKSVRVAMGGADAKAAQLLGKRHGSKLLAKAKIAKTEGVTTETKLADSEKTVDPAEEEAQLAKEKEERAEGERQKRLELAMRLDDRRFHTAEANESYVKFIRKGMKPEDATMSRVPQLGRGFDSSGCLELVVPSFARAQ